MGNLSGRDRRDGHRDNRDKPVEGDLATRSFAICCGPDPVATQQGTTARCQQGSRRTLRRCCADDAVCIEDEQGDLADDKRDRGRRAVADELLRFRHLGDEAGNGPAEGCDSGQPGAPRFDAGRRCGAVRISPSSGESIVSTCSTNASCSSLLRVSCESCKEIVRGFAADGDRPHAVGLSTTWTPFKRRPDR